jgi:Lysozyme like domain
VIRVVTLMCALAFSSFVADAHVRETYIMSSLANPASDVMTPSQIFTVMVRAGFPPVVATTMVAIALRESSGIPNVVNINPATGDKSYGLLQINLASPQVAADMQKAGITEEDLQTAEGNARAGFILFQGKLENLNIAWYINSTEGTYKARYEANLPIAQSAALGCTL